MMKRATDLRPLRLLSLLLAASLAFLASCKKPDSSEEIPPVTDPITAPDPITTLPPPDPDPLPVPVHVPDPAAPQRPKGPPKGPPKPPPVSEAEGSRYRPGATGPIGELRSGNEDPAIEGTEEASKEFHTVEVFYGTNRKPTGFTEPNDYYGRERHREGPMEYGKIDVSIPLHHTVGVVERPKWYKLEFSENPKKHVVLIALEAMEPDRFFAAVGEKAGDDAEKQALLFIHGYNVAFDDAVRRTAQIAFDLDFPGTPITFSWPSQAALEGYTIDQDNAIWSVPHLTRFLVDLQEKTDIENLHIIAHSMGTRVLTEALANARDEGFDLKLNNVILAAPDIDADVFRDQILPKIGGIARKLTMYSSTGDAALKVSQKIHGNDRLGLGGPFLKLLDGVDTVNATDIDTSLLGHGYYGSQKLIVQDILNTVIRNLDPPQRDLIRNPLGAWDFRELIEGKAEEAPAVVE